MLQLKVLEEELSIINLRLQEIYWDLLICNPGKVLKKELAQWH